MSDNKQITASKPSIFNRFKNRKKIYFARKVAKDIKRVRWPDAKTNWYNMLKIIIFTSLFALFVYAVTIGFTSLWKLIQAF
ncbi:preprotein translocase subunit SecE [Mycoplasma nasistruthionis]|uniref:Preprotein translocase subunit SecE n=1 Tax=Mycoplasma nasistruthionis TaxID=353852 RepID=A0A5B7XUF6_9MOLU|nr:preprotein translocase subunit SecE [Mycoplasma nasistruthionis]QCZ36499.1 preprotein translocase subunit SecE [Mycoplasma nasistruthionis]